MLLSGREIQTTCPPGIGSPSVGAGSRFSRTTTLESPLAFPAGETTRKCAFESSSQTVRATPRAYVPG